MLRLADYLICSCKFVLIVVRCRVRCLPIYTVKSQQLHRKIN